MQFPSEAIFDFDDYLPKPETENLKVLDKPTEIEQKWVKIDNRQFKGHFSRLLSKVKVIGLSGAQLGGVIYPWIISSLLSALQTSQVLNNSTYVQLKNVLIDKPKARIE